MIYTLSKHFGILDVLSRQITFGRPCLYIAVEADTYPIIYNEEKIKTAMLHA